MTQNPNMADMSYRSAAFRRVFGSPEGQDVLNWLKTVTHHRLTRPNLDNPNEVYYRLGQADTVKMIEDTINYERK